MLVLGSLVRDMIMMNVRVSYRKFGLEDVWEVN